MARLEYRRDFPIRKENVHRCDICCTYVSKSAFFIYNHMANRSCLRLPFNCEESNLEQYFCGICRLDFDTVISLKKHIKQEHSTEGKKTSTSLDTKYVCQNCPFQTISLLEWFKHVTDGCYAMNSLEKSVASTEKTKNTESTSSLRSHKMTCKNKRSFQCASLKRHYAGDVNADDKWFQCDKCAYRTLYKSTLKSHVSRKHANYAELLTKMFKCKKCTFTTVYKSSLKAHVDARHSDDQDKKWFQCDQCPYKSLYKRNLKLHINNRHTDKAQRKSFNCEVCTFKTTDKSHLKKHNDIKHADEQDKRWYQCDQCTYKSLYKRNVKQHIHNVHRDKSQETKRVKDARLKQEIKIKMIRM